LLKYYKLNIENVKQVTNLGHCLTYDGEVFEFDWSTKEINFINLNNIKQIESVIFNISDYNVVTLTNDGDVFYHGLKINYDKILEIHVYNDQLISMNENDVYVLNLKTFQEFTFKI
jgi:hypothetical protein